MDNPVKQKILLLVEDEVLLAKTQTKLLNRQGYQIIHALTGEDAIRIISEKENEIDLILMDIDLGTGLDGTETAGIILRDHNIPLIFVSSHTEWEIVHKTETITSYGYVVKNSGITVLDASIKMAFKLFDAINERKKAEQEVLALNGKLQKLLSDTNKSLESEIIAHARAEKSLHESENRFRAAQEISLEAFTILNSIRNEKGEIIDFVWTYANPVAGQILKISPEKLIGQRLLDLLPGNQENRALFQRYVDIVETGQGNEVELKYTSDGIDGWFRNMTVKLGDGIAVSFSDITERKKAMTEAQLQAIRFREALDHIPSYIYMKDSNYRYVYANEPTLKLFQCSAEELVGSEDSRFFPPDTVNRLREVDRRIIENGENTYEEIESITDAGRRVYLELKAPIYTDYEKKHIWGLCGISTDITERKLAEEQVFALLKEKELILKEVHHRIKNNMATVLSLLTIQADSNSDSAVKEILLDAANRLQSMTVLYDKIYRSKGINGVSPADYFTSLIHAIIRIFSIKDSIHTKIQVDGDINLNPNILSPLGIIINELVTNSMKYAFRDRTGGVISLTISKKDKNILLEFSDNGCGIPDSVVLENQTGFGLELVEMLVRQIKGTISLVRKEGTGFIIEFPPG